jgi:hypothetical protein
MYFVMQMPDCLPGLKPEADPGPARPSTSVLSHLLPNDTAEVLQLFLKFMHHQQIKLQSEF